MPVKARTQEEAAEKAQQAYAAKPKAEAKTGRNFFERLRPEKVRSEADANFARGRHRLPCMLFNLHLCDLS